MRRTAVALSAATLVATLGACSQGSGPGLPAPSSDSGTKTSTEPFKNVASLVSSAKSTMGEKKTFTLAYEITGAGQSINMTCQVDVVQTAVACTGQTEMVFTKDGVYVKNPMAGSGKPWIRMKSTEMEQALGALSKIDDFASMLPPGTNITSSTEEQVDGQQATRYEVVTDVKQAAANAPADEKQMYQPLVDSGISELKQTIWMSSDGLPLKVNTNTPAMTMMGQKVPELKMTMRYKDWGKPVQITVPPANQVQDR